MAEKKVVSEYKPRERERHFPQGSCRPMRTVHPVAVTVDDQGSVWSAKEAERE